MANINMWYHKGQIGKRNQKILDRKFNLQSDTELEVLLELVFNSKIQVMLQGLLAFHLCFTPQKSHQLE
jgi:hypothetical protein